MLRDSFQLNFPVEMIQDGDNDETNSGFNYITFVTKRPKKKKTLMSDCTDLYLLKTFKSTFKMPVLLRTI